VTGPSISTSWQTYELNLADFSPALDITTIKQLDFVFEDWNVGAQTGTVYFDEIEFDQ
jgi:hypothetical protein